MKKVLFAVVAIAFIGVNTLKAQDEKVIEERKLKEEKVKDMKKTQEIVIRQKGAVDIDTKVVVEIKGDKVTINGKPISEFKDDNITINRRNITVWDSKGNKTFEMVPGEFMEGFKMFGDGNDEPHAFLGVTTDDDDAGAKITEISKGNAAEKAGLKVGDIITKLGDKKIDGPNSLSEAVLARKPKEEVTVWYKRDGKENSSKVILGEKKGMGMSYSFSAPKVAAPRTPYTYSIPKGESWNLNGENNFDFSGVFPRHQKLGLKIQDTEDGKGVKVLEVDKDSPAEKAGLKKDDIVVEVAGKKVENTDEARHQLQENQGKAAYSIKAKRNGNEMSFEIKIPKKLKTANL